MGVLVLCACAAAQTYSITDLGALPNDETSSGMALSDTGQVVGGVAGNDIFDQQPYAFRWETRTGIHSLAVLPTGWNSTAYGVNSAEQIVGSSSVLISGFLLGHAFLWTSGQMQDLGTLPGGSNSTATAINRYGTVVGYSDFSSAFFLPHAFLWSPNTGMKDLGTLLGTTMSKATGINGRGEIVGTSGDPCWWDSSGLIHDLGTLPGDSGGAALGINNMRQIVGYSYSAGAQYHAFSWTKTGGMTALGALPGGSLSMALGINRAGQIVGFSSYGGYAYSTHATLWTSSGPQDLNLLIPFNSGWTDLISATAINNSGQITGVGNVTTQHGVAQHAFLLTPQ